MIPRLFESLRDKVDAEHYTEKESLPEQQLWAEVIYRSLHDIQFYLLTLRPDLKLYAKVSRRWLLSQNKDTGSFIWCLSVVFPQETLQEAAYERIIHIASPNLPLSEDEYDDQKINIIYQNASRGDLLASLNRTRGHKKDTDVSLANIQQLQKYLCEGMKEDPQHFLQ